MIKITFELTIGSFFAFLNLNSIMSALLFHSGGINKDFGNSIKV